MTEPHDDEEAPRAAPSTYTKYRRKSFFVVAVILVYLPTWRNLRRTVVSSESLHQDAEAVLLGIVAANHTRSDIDVNVTGDIADSKNATLSKDASNTSHVDPSFFQSICGVPRPEYAPPTTRQDHDKIALCTIHLNEWQFLPSWIDYHLAIGFDHIFVYDNGPLPLDTESHNLLKMTWNDRVSYIHFPDRVKQQGKAFADCMGLQSRARGMLYAMGMDSDEYLVLISDKLHTVQDLVRDYLPGGQLSLSWRSYGFSGQDVALDLPLPARFACRANDTSPDANNEYVKSIVKVSDFVSTDNPHVVTQMRNGTRQHSTHGVVRWPDYYPYPLTRLQPKRFDVAIVYHYYTRSREEYVEKRIRGYANDHGPSYYQQALALARQGKKPDGKAVPGSDFYDTIVWTRLKDMVPQYAACERMDLFERARANWTCLPT